ncbi:hypothetical protein ACJRO7_029411, partial [Eucalyptus globulus]
MSQPNIKISALILLLSVITMTWSASSPDVIESLLTRLESKRASPLVQETAAAGVLKRLLPFHSHSFQFKIGPEVSLSQILRNEVEAEPVAPLSQVTVEPQLMNSGN